jgi:hypothetical protein
MVVSKMINFCVLMYRSSGGGCEKSSAALVGRIRGTAELGKLFCARGAQQQASQEKQAGGGRNEKGDG